MTVGHGEGGEHHPERRVEALDRLQHPHRRHLHQVVERLALAGEAPGAMLRQPAVLLDQSLRSARSCGGPVLRERGSDLFGLDR